MFQRAHRRKKRKNHLTKRNATFHIHFMKYNIRALNLVDHTELAKRLVGAGVSEDLDRAKTVIRSWGSKRGFVSTDGERVIRQWMEEGPDQVDLKTEDFWDPDVWEKKTTKHGIFDQARLESRLGGKVPA